MFVGLLSQYLLPFIAYSLQAPADRVRSAFASVLVATNIAILE